MSSIMNQSSVSHLNSTDRTVDDVNNINEDISIISSEEEIANSTELLHKELITDNASDEKKKIALPHSEEEKLAILVSRYIFTGEME